MIPEKLLYKYIEEICQEKGIELEVLSYGWIRKLTKNGKSGFIIGNKFGLNDEVSFLIARDKYATFEILKNNNIPVIEHKMIFSPTKRSQYYDESFIKEAERLAERHDGKIIIIEHFFNSISYFFYVLTINYFFSFTRIICFNDYFSIMSFS